jgi:hypothetical protein
MWQTSRREETIMATDMRSDAIYHPDFDLGEFRYAVARYVKFLIRARWKCQPEFLSEEELAAWSLADIGHDNWPAWQLLDQAALALAHLNRHFLPRCGSGGVRETDDATPVGRLIRAVAFLAYIDGGGPEHNGALVDAARRLREGQTVDWAALVAWDDLQAIRADLDGLPHPAGEGAPLAPSRLDRIEALLTSLVEREQIKDWYDVEEFAGIVSKAEFTCREWCRLGRIRATKKRSGRGKYQSWAISHDELLRYRKDGLLPFSR